MSEFPTVDEMEAYLRENMPPGPVKLSPGATIIDPAKFVRSMVGILRHNKGNRAFMPYYEHLRDFFLIVKNQKNG